MENDPGQESRPGLQPIRVSVIIPAYNCANSIAAALNSVLEQTFSGYEIIVVNDGSPDTPQLDQALAPYMDRIRYLRQENRGPSGARNTGILEARGKYVAFLDSDDRWLPQHLAAQVALLESDPALGLVYADAVLIVNDVQVRTSFQASPQSHPVTFEALITEQCSVVTSATVASRAALIKAGLFDEQFKRCEDFDLWARVMQRGFRIDYAREVQVVHRCGDGLSSDAEAMKRSLIAVYAKMASQLPVSEAQKQLILRRHARAQAELQLELCKKCLLAGQPSEALAAAESAHGLDTWKLRPLILALRVASRPVAFVYRFYVRALERRRQARLARLRFNLKSVERAASMGATVGVRNSRP